MPESSSFRISEAEREYIRRKARVAQQLGEPNPDRSASSEYELGSFVLRLLNVLEASERSAETRERETRKENRNLQEVLKVTEEREVVLERRLERQKEALLGLRARLVEGLLDPEGDDQGYINIIDDALEDK